MFRRQSFHLLFDNPFVVRSSRSSYHYPLGFLPHTFFSFNSYSDKSRNETQNIQLEIKKHKESLQTAWLSNNFSDFLENAVKVQTLKKQIYGDSYQDGLYEDLTNLGYGYLVQGKLSEALSFFLASLDKAQGKIETMETQLNLGLIYRVSKDFGMALSNLEKAYVHAKFLFLGGLSSPDKTLLRVAQKTIIISKNLIDMYLISPEGHEKARLVWVENLQIFSGLIRLEIIFQDPNVETILQHYYTCCDQNFEIAMLKKDYSTAQMVVEHIIEAANQTDSNYYGAKGNFNQGLILIAQDKPIESLDVFREAKEILEKVLNSKEATDSEFSKDCVALIYCCYGGMIHASSKAGLLDQKKKLKEEFKEFGKTRTLEDPFDFYQVLAHDVEILMKDNKISEALRILKEIEADTSEIDLNNQKNLAFRSYILTNLVKVSMEEGNYEEALRAGLANEPFIDQIRKNFELQPEEKVSIIENYYELGLVNQKLKKYKEAEKYLIYALELYEENGAVNKAFGVALDLACIYEEFGEGKKAEEMYIKSLEIKKRHSGENSQEIENLKRKIDEIKRKIYQ